MKNNISKKIIGVLLVVLGVMMALSLLEVVDFSAALRGWWTMFIIIPCLISLVFDGFNMVNTIGLGIGCILFLSAQNIIPYRIGWQLVFPYIIIVFGVKMIFVKGSKKTNDDDFEFVKQTKKSNFCAVFSGNSPCFDGQNFDGCSCCAVFGGVELKLKNSLILKNCEIKTCSIFGGTDIFLPSNVKVVVESTNILGGVNNKFTSSLDNDAPVVFVKNTCIFGGLNIK